MDAHQTANYIVDGVFVVCLVVLFVECIVRNLRAFHTRQRARWASPLTEAQAALVREMIEDRLKLDGLDKLRIRRPTKARISAFENHVPNVEETQTIAIDCVREHMRSYHAEEVAKRANETDTEARARYEKTALILGTKV